MSQKLLKFHKLVKNFFQLDFSYKVMAIEAVYLTAMSRFLIINIKFRKLNKRLGVKGVELSKVGKNEGYLVAKKVAIVVNKIADITPWESKCLVRSMAAQRMMKRRGYGTTLYLGVGKDEDGMNAHSWLRYGELYLTGGNGSKHAKVAQFSTSGVNDANI